MRLTVLVMEVVGIPPVLAIVVLLMVRKGPLKDWLIRILLLVPISFILFTIPGIFLVVTIALYRDNRLAGNDLGNLLRGGCTSLAFVIVLGWVFAHFLWRVVPGRCPECRLPTLLSTVAISPRLTKEGVYQCLACKGQFQKLGGVWTPTPPELDSGPGSS